MMGDEPDAVGPVTSFPGRNALVRSFCIADSIRVLLGEKGHSDSDFFLIFSDNRLQEGQEVLSLLRVFLSG